MLGHFTMIKDADRYIVLCPFSTWSGELFFMFLDLTKTEHFDRELS